jgi:hypothetical protein
MRIARGAAAIDRTPEDPVVEDIAPGRAEALKAQPSDAESRYTLNCDCEEPK